MSNPTQNILCILATMVLADNRIHFSEIEAFLSACRRLRSRVSAFDYSDESYLLRWFDANREAVRERISHEYFREWLDSQLGGIREHISFMPLARELHDIAIADEEMHCNETAFLSLIEAKLCGTRKLH